MTGQQDLALRIDGLTVAYRGAFRAVDGLSLQVGTDETVALVGESGCGKSTVLRAVLGLLPERARVEGAIVLSQMPLHELGRRERRMAQQQTGYVTQDPYSAYDPLRTIRHHVLEPLRARRVALEESSTLERMAAAGVPEPRTRWKQYPHQWSGGMLQRADIIAATGLDPLITLADEPTSALDTELADEMMQLLRRQSRAVLFVTHDLELAARHADRVVVMDRGRVVEQAAPAVLFAQPTHPQTQRLIESVRERAEVRQGPARASGAVVAELVGVTKRYQSRAGSQVAVDAVDLRVCSGEIVGIHGRSGSGKSTLLRLLGRLEEPDSGRVDVQAGTGVVLPIFQDPVSSLDQRWPIWRSVTEPLLVRNGRTGTKPPSRRRRFEFARDALDAVGLGHLDPATFPGALSVGQCQRVAIARAVCAAPPLVIADEPTASLDVTTAGEIARLLEGLRDLGTALVIVSHDVTFLRMLADRVLRMDGGRLEQPLALGRDR